MRLVGVLAVVVIAACSRTDDATTSDDALRTTSVEIATRAALPVAEPSGLGKRTVGVEEWTYKDREAGASCCSVTKDASRCASSASCRRTRTVST